MPPLLHAAAAGSSDAAAAVVRRRHLLQVQCMKKSAAYRSARKLVLQNRRLQRLLSRLPPRHREPQLSAATTSASTTALPASSWAQDNGRLPINALPHDTKAFLVRAALCRAEHWKSRAALLAEGLTIERDVTTEEERSAPLLEVAGCKFDISSLAKEWTSSETLRQLLLPESQRGSWMELSGTPESSAAADVPPATTRLPAAITLVYSCPEVMPTYTHPMCYILGLSPEWLCSNGTSDSSTGGVATAASREGRRKKGGSKKMIQRSHAAWSKLLYSKTGSGSLTQQLLRTVAFHSGRSCSLRCLPEATAAGCFLYQTYRLDAYHSYNIARHAEEFHYHLLYLCVDPCMALQTGLFDACSSNSAAGGDLPGSVLKAAEFRIPLHTNLLLSGVLSPFGFQHPRVVDLPVRGNSAALRAEGSDTDRRTAAKEGEREQLSLLRLRVTRGRDEPGRAGADEDESEGGAAQSSAAPAAEKEDHEKASSSPAKFRSVSQLLSPLLQHTMDQLKALSPSSRCTEQPPPRPSSASLSVTAAALNSTTRSSEGPPPLPADQRALYLPVWVTSRVSGDARGVTPCALLQRMDKKTTTTTAAPGERQPGTYPLSFLDAGMKVISEVLLPLLQEAPPLAQAGASSSAGGASGDDDDDGGGFLWTEPLLAKALAKRIVGETSDRCQSSTGWLENGEQLRTMCFPSDLFAHIRPPRLLYRSDEVDTVVADGDDDDDDRLLLVHDEGFIQKVLIPKMMQYARRHGCVSKVAQKGEVRGDGAAGSTTDGSSEHRWMSTADCIAVQQCLSIYEAKAMAMTSKTGTGAPAGGGGGTAARWFSSYVWRQLSPAAKKKWMGMSRPKKKIFWQRWRAIEAQRPTPQQQQPAEGVEPLTSCRSDYAFVPIQSFMMWASTTPRQRERLRRRLSPSSCGGETTATSRPSLSFPSSERLKCLCYFAAFPQHFALLEGNAGKVVCVKLPSEGELEAALVSP